MRDSTRVFFAISIFVFASFAAFAQSKLLDTDGYYVVIGAYKVPKNAMNRAEQARLEFYKAEYAWNEKRKLYYVYIMTSADKQSAVNLALELQKQPNYSDTWVYTTILSAEPEKLDLTDSTVTVTEKRPDQPVQTKAEEGTRPFIFRIRSVSTSQDIVGEVDIYDADIVKGKRAASYRSEELVNVKPINKSGNMSVVCDIFGYRKVVVPINFNNPQPGEGITMEDGKVVITFDLVRYRKGDKATMYHVYFFKDAAIMRPESRNEVNALLEFMKEKDQAKIMLHGHTNGSAHGKIISMGDSKDFWSLSTQNKEGFGSAVKLSEERAKVIQQFLIMQGIDEKRMVIKGWGGKKPVYDDDHPAAIANVRVEVEVLED